MSEADVKKARSDKRKAKDKAPVAEPKVSSNSSAKPRLWPTSCIDLLKGKTTAIKPPKPAAAKPSGKRGKEPVPNAESAAEPSGPSHTTGRRLRDRSAEPPPEDNAPVSKPPEDEVATARPRRRLKADVKLAVEKNLRKGK